MKSKIGHIVSVSQFGVGQVQDYASGEFYNFNYADVEKDFAIELYQTVKFDLYNKHHGNYSTTWAKNLRAPVGKQPIYSAPVFVIDFTQRKLKYIIKKES